MTDLEIRNNTPQTSSTSSPPATSSTNENGSSRDPTPDKSQGHGKVEELIKKFGLSEKAARAIIDSEFDDDNPKDTCIKDMTRTINNDKKEIQILKQQLEQMSKEARFPKDEVTKSFKKLKNGEVMDTLGITDETINALEELMKQRAKDRMDSNLFNYKAPNVPEGEIEELPEENSIKKQLENSDVIITSLFNTMTAASDYIRGNEQGYKSVQDFRRKRMGARSAFYDVLTNDNGFEVHDNNDAKKNKSVTFSAPPSRVAHARIKTPLYNDDSSSSSRNNGRPGQNSNVSPPATNDDTIDLARMNKKQKLDLLNYI